MGHRLGGGLDRDLVAGKLEGCRWPASGVARMGREELSVSVAMFCWIEQDISFFDETTVGSELDHAPTRPMLDLRTRPPPTQTLAVRTLRLEDHTPWGGLA